MTQAATFLQQAGEAIQRDFREKKRILSAEEFFDLVLAEPQLHLRSAAHYVKDCMEHYGTRELRPGVTRYSLFDIPFEKGELRLAGHERVQAEVHRALENFVRQGKVDRLILLHGPNGSAKSTLIACLLRALEHFSEQDRGVLYSFRWVFPTEKIRKGLIGYGTGEKPESFDPSRSYAYLSDDQVDARIPSELRDHPLLLLPRPQREAFIAEVKKRLPPDFVIPQWLVRGELEHRSRLIFESLLAAHRGDYLAVLRYVQVERFYISRRYRSAAITVEPQMSVDARSRQLTLERSLQALPPALQNIAFYDLSGELVDANRGVIEYNDLLKRPLEAFKYLLSACENGRVSVEHTILFLDLVFLASANDKYLNAFKEAPDWPSFRGRFELIRVPYLLDYLREREVYDAQLTPEGARKHIAPHTTLVAALWAVLTRLKPPQGEHFPKNVQALVTSLTPLEKAELYARGRAPNRFSPEEARLLESTLPALWSEFETAPEYEGSRGASAREMKTCLLNAAQDPRFPCLSPLAVAEELRALLKETSTYEFLQRRPQGGYFDHEAFIEIALTRYLDLADAELRASLGMVEDNQYRDLFARYAAQVSYWVKGEKYLNPVTNTYDEPSKSLMGEIEKALGVEADANSFRRNLIAQIGAWSLDHPGVPVDYAALFPRHLERLERSFYEQNKKQIVRGLKALLALAAGDPEADQAERARAEAAMARLIRDHGYNAQSLQETISYLLKKRYP